ncbi:MAG TPA: DUF4062 domain-containing protein, partial [Ktedonobacteraceae bacterium]
RELRRQILEILYEGKDDPTLALDEEDFAERFRKPLHEVKSEVDKLQKDGLITTRIRSGPTHTYHFFVLTPAGIEEAEGHPVKQLTVFISSPRDVMKEREAAIRAVQHCNDLASISKHYVLKALRYETDVPPEAGDEPQIIVNRYMLEAGKADIFICILSQRMGTPVLVESTGKHYKSGTEYEFMSAYESHQKQRKPHIMLYRKQINRLPKDLDREQWERVNEFFNQFEGGPSAPLKGLYKPYPKTEEFETLLFHDLITLLDEHFLD